MNATVKPGTAEKKVTKDTPVAPSEAVQHLKSIVNPIGEQLKQLPNHNPDAFALSEPQTIRNGDVTRSAMNLTIADTRMGITVRGSEIASAQKSNPTTITVTDLGKQTVFEPRRDATGQVSFVNQATVGEQGRKKGIYKPQTLADFIHDAVHATPNNDFTHRTTRKPVVAAEPTLANPGETQPVTAAPPKVAHLGARRPLQATVETPEDAQQRVNAARARAPEAKTPAITAGSDKGLDQIKAPNLTLETQAQVGGRTRDAGYAALRTQQMQQAAATNILTQGAEKPGGQALSIEGDAAAHSRATGATVGKNALSTRKKFAGPGGTNSGM